MDEKLEDIIKLYKSRELGVLYNKYKVDGVLSYLIQTIEQQQEKIKWLENHNELLKDTDYEIKVKPTFKF